jgi:hypothetical protein
VQRVVAALLLVATVGILLVVAGVSFDSGVVWALGFPWSSFAFIAAMSAASTAVIYSLLFGAVAMNVALLAGFVAIGRRLVTRWRG